jgi:ATP-binding cassette, subfamily C (CFTR/MRP), member 1
MVAAIPKLFQIGFTYTQPFLISAAIRLASLPQGQPYDNIGYGLIGAYAIVYTGIAVSSKCTRVSDAIFPKDNSQISTGHFEWRAQRAASMLRGGVVSLIYQKSLRLDVTAPDVSPEGALTLMNTDVETAMQGVLFLHNFWGALLEIAVGIYLLYRQLGAACAMPVAVVFGE